MQRFAATLAALLVTISVNAEVQQVNFTASDGVRVHADLYTSTDGPSAPIVLLFHQAGGDARGEYARITPRLLERGYSVLAVDLRSGGDRFGGVNRTSAALGATDYGYCEVYPDLEAALRFARDSGFDGPLAAWGSSYSAALVFQLGARHGDEVDAVLGFSPASGAPLAACRPEQFLEALTVPVLALRPQREFEIESVREQMASFAAAGVQTHVADPGVHGSSMLDAERVNASTEPAWTVVFDFLDAALAGD